MSAERPEDAAEAAARSADDPVAAALRAFILAYANVESLDDDGIEVALFRAWLMGVSALGLHPPGPTTPRRRAR